MKPKSKQIVAIVGLFSVLIVAGVGLWLIKARQLHAAEAQRLSQQFEPAESVRATRAAIAEWQVSSKLSGTVIAMRSVTLANEVAGRITEIGFDSGSIVAPGQVLLVLDSASEQADLLAAKATVAVGEATIRASDARLGLAKLTLDRTRKAADGNAVPMSDLDKADADVLAAAADVDRAKAETAQFRARVKQVEAMIEKKTILAPFNGLAGLRNMHPGQYIAEGTTIVGLQEISDKVFLDFAVPQEHADKAVVGMTVPAESPLFPGRIINITVAALDATVNPSTRNVRIRGIIEDPTRRLKPGMFVEVSVPIGAPQRVITVESSAVRRAAFGDHTFVLEASTKPGDAPGTVRAKQRFITLGPAIDARTVIVTRGLEAGEQVAAEGSFKLRDGATVMIAPAAPSTAADAIMPADPAR